MPDPIIYPDLLPTTDYDLSADAIHSHTRPGLPSVQVPGFEHEYQLASECPAHLWPHNAAKIGMVRYIPPADSVPGSRRLLGYCSNDEVIVIVHFAFLYTHPGLNCHHCASEGLDCVQFSWDGPDQDGSLPNPVTDSLTVYDCVRCYGSNVPCPNRGIHILEPGRSALKVGQKLAQQMIDSRKNFRQNIRPPQGFLTSYYTSLNQSKQKRKRARSPTSPILTSATDYMEQLDLDQNATRENFKKILEERDHLGRQVETSRAEADVQRRKAEENRAELAEEHAKQAEDERKQRKRVEEAERRARVAEGERDQARANSTPAHSTSRDSFSGLMIRDGQPNPTGTPNKQIDALKDTIANLQARLAASVDEKEKLQAQLNTADRRIIDLERSQLGGWSG